RQIVMPARHHAATAVHDRCHFAHDTVEAAVGILDVVLREVSTHDRAVECADSACIEAYAQIGVDAFDFRLAEVQIDLIDVDDASRQTGCGGFRCAARD